MSLWRESFGRVAVEAMANGIPVLASDRGARGSRATEDKTFLILAAQRAARVREGN
jgi:glycosyltransferase involved in cell wall biosynthesis